MNELTWRQVLLWERTHGDKARLVRFVGRPDELTPRARVRSLFGGACLFACLQHPVGVLC